MWRSIKAEAFTVLSLIELKRYFPLPNKIKLFAFSSTSN